MLSIYFDVLCHIDYVISLKATLFMMMLQKRKLTMLPKIYSTVLCNYQACNHCWWRSLQAFQQLHESCNMMQLACYQIDIIQGLQWILTIQSKAERTIKNFSYLLVLFLYLFSICREWPCSIDLAILEDFFMQR